MDPWKLLLQLVILLGVALTLGTLAIRLRQKAVVGYLVAGVLLGPGVLGLVNSTDAVEFLAEVGVALLLFTIGLEFSWARLLLLGGRIAAAGLLQILLSAAMAAAIARWLGLSLNAAIVTGAAISLSSTALVLRILADRAEIESVHGRSALGVLILQDMALVPLLVLVSVLAGAGSGVEGVWAMAASLVRGGAMVALFAAVLRVVLPRAFPAATEGERDAPVVLSVVVCLGCSWAAHSAGISPASGAFIAGLMLADQPLADQFRANVMPLRAVFVTLFFASIGMLAAVPSGPSLFRVLALAAAIIAGKTIVAAIALRLGRVAWGPAFRAGLAVSQIGEFSFVLAEEAKRKQLVADTAMQPLLSAAVITLIATPYLIAAGEKLERFLQRRQSVEGREVPAPRKQHVIVAGYGPAGHRVIDALEAKGVPVRLIEMNPAVLGRVNQGMRVVLGDAASADILTHAGLASARALVVTIPDPAAARNIVGVARTIAPGVPIHVRARYHIYAQGLRDAGAWVVVDEEDTVGERLAAGTLRELGI